MLIYDLILLGIIILLFILYLLYLIFSSRSSPTTTSTTLKGREGYVIEDIHPKDIKGKVRVIHSSRIWSATAKEKIEEGTKVKIKEVEGVHLVVEKIEREEELKEPDRNKIFQKFTALIDYIKETSPGIISFFREKLGKKNKD